MATAWVSTRGVHHIFINGIYCYCSSSNTHKNRSTSSTANGRSTHNLSPSVKRAISQFFNTTEKKDCAFIDWPLGSDSPNRSQSKKRKQTKMQASRSEQKETPKQDSVSGNDNWGANQQDNFSLDVDDHEEAEKQKTAAVKLRAELEEIKTEKAEIESQLQLRTKELQAMKTKASNAEERVKSVEERLTHALQAKRDGISAMGTMKVRYEGALKRKEEEKREVKTELQMKTTQLQEMKNKIEELEESAKKSPKRVQLTRRRKSSLETLDLEPWRSNNRWENVRDNEEIDALRSEILATIKTNNTVTMAAVGGMNDVKEALLNAIVLPKKSAQRPGLALLYGPSGTGV